ncbi:hypothetical protein E6W30_34515, partial [Pseudomonas aeruginosa]
MEAPRRACQLRAGSRPDPGRDRAPGPCGLTAEPGGAAMRRALIPIGIFLALGLLLVLVGDALLPIR